MKILTLALSLLALIGASTLSASADWRPGPGGPGHGPGPGRPGWGPGGPGPGPGGPGWGPGGPGHGPGGPGWGPGGPGHGPGPGRMIECVATNLRGMQFYGRAPWQQDAERQAIDSCYRAGSRQCSIRQCYPAGGGGWNPPPPPPPRVQYIQCESSQYRFNSCPVNGQIQSVQLSRQDSAASCTLGQSYGYQNNSVWVDRGCRGVFAVYLY